MKFSDAIDLTTRVLGTAMRLKTWPKDVKVRAVFPRSGAPYLQKEWVEDEINRITRWDPVAQHVFSFDWELVHDGKR